MKAVILVGGPHVGTRFRPLSLEVPKPLFLIAGAPMVQHIIEACTKLSGITEILLLGTFQSREMNRFAKEMEHQYRLPVRYLQEYTPLGTAGGLYHFRDLILKGSPSSFFVFNCDVCCHFPVEEMVQFHARVAGGRGFVILGTEANETQAPNYGCIVEDPSGTHKVLHYVEKPDSYVSNVINAGVYLLTPEVFEVLGEVFQGNYGTPSSENGGSPKHRDAIDLGRNVLAPMAGSGKIFVYKMEGFWTQVKNAGSALYANRFYLSVYRKTHPEWLAENSPGCPTVLGDVRIHPSAHVDPSATLGPNVYVGAGASIGAGARIKEAIVLDRADIKEHSCVLHSIVGWDCVVGAWSRVEGYPSDPNPNDPFAHVTSESLFNEDGRMNPSITVLGEGVHVRSELMVLNSIILPHKDLASSFRNQIIL